MKSLQAHEVIARAYAAAPEAIAAWLPGDCEPQHHEGIDPTVALLTGGIALSGCLEDSETLDDLKEGCEHFASLLSAGVITAEDWNQATLDLIGELMAWGDALEAKRL